MERARQLCACPGACLVECRTVLRAGSVDRWLRQRHNCCWHIPRYRRIIFSGGRWPSLRIQRCLRGADCLYVRTLEHFDLQPALAVITYRLLSSKCRGPLVRGIMNYLSARSWHRLPLVRILRTTSYVLVVHARMFNELEVPVEAEGVSERLSLWTNGRRTPLGRRRGARI